MSCNPLNIAGRASTAGLMHALTSGLASCFLAVGLVLADPVFAQQSPAQVGGEARENDVLEEVIVTGTRIKRRDFFSPSPLATIDRADLQATGRTTLEETLNLMPQVQPDLSRTVNSGGDGTAAVNLRGVGAGRTLVLLNGRRFAPSGTGSAVDINNIPRSLLEKVEIITGGASTVYGSDAIAGVVNFITRDDFEGVSLDATYNLSGDGDAEIFNVDVSFGHNLANERGNLAVYAGYYDRQDLLAGERDFTRVSIENDPLTGELFESGSPATPSAAIFVPPVDLGSGPGFVTFDANGVPEVFTPPDDFYNFQPINYLQTPLQRTTVGLLGKYEINANYELYFESGFARNDSIQQLAEVAVFTFAQVNIGNPVLSPEARQLFEENYQVEPGVAAFGFGRRLSEVGPRIIEHERDYWRTVVGLRGNLGADWEIDAWMTYTHAEEQEFYRNDASRTRLQQGLLVDPVSGECFDPSGGCVPVNIFGPGTISEEAADFLRVTNVQNDTERTQKLAAVVVTGSLFDTWAGPVEKALGVEWRSDKASFTADEVLFSGDTLGFVGAAPVEGTESVVELYAEAVVPLVEDQAWAEYLALELGARYSSYDLAGGVWTYKYGANWQVTDGLRFRGMGQHSVRAPNNAELFTEQFTEFSFFVGTDSSEDPCSASNDPVALGFTEKCVIQGMPAELVGTFEASSVPTAFVLGGNPDLEPESADTLTLGFVIEPLSLEKWQFSVDYFDIELSNSIGDVDVTAICFDRSNTSHVFCENITRDAAAGYNVVEVFSPQSNRGRITARGIDTQVRYGTELPEVLSWFGDPADFSFNLYWTHTLENKWQLNPVSGVIDCLGIFGDFCPIDRAGVGGTMPENRIFSEMRYDAGNLSVFLNTSWIEGTLNGSAREAEFFGEPQPLLAVSSVGSKMYLDLGIGYAVTDNIYLRAGVNNLTDTDPPLMPRVTNNTDTVLYDVFGRSYFLSVSARIGQ